MNETRRDHWEQVYAQKGSAGVSWHRPHLDTSLELIAAAGVDPEARVIDIGGGASTLVDDLIARGFHHISVADLSAAALELSRARLGTAADTVTWIQGDATALELAPDAFDLWHDRAVFHFLTEPAQRDAYLVRLRRSLAPGGLIIMATFALNGPEKCSGLPVIRYSVDTLEAVLGPSFERIAEAADLHTTPWGSTQSFVYGVWRRTA